MRWFTQVNLLLFTNLYLISQNTQSEYQLNLLFKASGETEDVFIGESKIYLSGRDSLYVIDTIGALIRNINGLNLVFKEIDTSFYYVNVLGNILNSDFTKPVFVSKEMKSIRNFSDCHYFKNKLICTGRFGEICTYSNSKGQFNEFTSFYEKKLRRNIEVQESFINDSKLFLITNTGLLSKNLIIYDEDFELITSIPFTSFALSKNFIFVSKQNEILYLDVNSKSKPVLLNYKSTFKINDLIVDDYGSLWILMDDRFDRLSAIEEVIYQGIEPKSSPETFRFSNYGKFINIEYSEGNSLYLQTNKGYLFSLKFKMPTFNSCGKRRKAFCFEMTGMKLSRDFRFSNVGSSIFKSEFDRTKIHFEEKFGKTKIFEYDGFKIYVDL